jgi:hypothetical protein
MLSQEREHAALGHQVTDHRPRIQHIAVRLLHTLHAMSITHQATQGTPDTPSYSGPS